MPKKKRLKLSTMSKRLDNAVKRYVKERDSQTCQCCGIHRDATPQGYLDWSHKISRNNFVLRWMEWNTIAVCRTCHQQWAQGITKPTNEAIDRIWGEGTSRRLEDIAREYTMSKGTYLDMIDFRLELESHYKQKLKLLEQGVSVNEVKTAVWKDFGLDKENVFDEEQCNDND